MTYGSRSCEVCLEPYRPTYGAQRTCGRRCGALFNWAAQRGSDIMWSCSSVPWRECEQCNAPFVEPNRRRKISRCRRCPTILIRDETIVTRCGQCKLEFAYKRRTRPRTLCGTCVDVNRRASRKRDKASRRAYMQADSAEMIWPEEIYRRDRFTCQLCGKRLAMRQVVPHPKAPTLDHVLPLAKGGEHTRANVQAAHFLCNSLKQTGGAEQLALIG